LKNYNASGAELIMGHGRFVAPKTLEVRLNDGGTRTLEGYQIFLNVGTSAAIPSIPGLVASRPLTNIEALDLDHTPTHLIVLGGGYVGLELAQAFRRFGSRVTIIEPKSQLLSREDPDVSLAIGRILEDEGIRILLNAEILNVRGRSGEHVTLVVRTRSGEIDVEGCDILVAVGRTPNTAGIGLEDIGIELDPNGYIRVNDRLETSAPGIWALGECAGTPQFTHASEDDFRVIRDNLAGGERCTRDRLIPYCVFTDPPLAHVGLTETEARKQNKSARVAKMATSHVLRTQATGEKQGFLKGLVCPKTDSILGFTMIGAEAGEVMAAMQIAMLAELPYSKLSNVIFAHPTMAEGLASLFNNLSAPNEHIAD
jgi:pyruvate/2-oxoglutarate dehydrogenase complex dihydrolipoamide dehydrogenase (E3) component